MGLGDGRSPVDQAALRVVASNAILYTGCVCVVF